MDNKKRVALVTGASAGIGETTAIKLAEERCDLVLVDINEEKMSLIGEKSRLFLTSDKENQLITAKIKGAITAGRNMAGIIFAVFTFEAPSTLVPTRITTNEPVVDI